MGCVVRFCSVTDNMCNIVPELPSDNVAIVIKWSFIQAAATYISVMFANIVYRDISQNISI